MFPDRAALYIVAIEDRQYKDFKIHCEYVIHTAVNKISRGTLLLTLCIFDHQMQYGLRVPKSIL